MIKYKQPLTGNSVSNEATRNASGRSDDNFNPVIAANREPSPGVEPEQPGTRVRNGDDRPNPEWIRGTCPECGESLVSNMYYVGGWGYLIVWECWGSLGENPQCCYRRVL